MGPDVNSFSYLLRIDYRKFLQDVVDNNPNAKIAIVGHSMGGAIITAEGDFTNKFESIKNVSLLAPAVMGDIRRMVSPAKVFCRNMHKDVIKAQTASNRFGGKGPSLFSLLNFMRKAAHSLKRLMGLQGKRQVVDWHIYSGKKDASVNYAEFEEYKSNKNVHFFGRGDHALQFGRHSGTVIRQLLANAESKIATQSQQTQSP